MTKTLDGKAPASLSDVFAGGRRLLLEAGALSMFANLLMLAGPLYMLQIFDRVLSSGSMETLLFLSLLTAFLFICMGLIETARDAIVSRAAAQFEQRLEPVIFNLSMDAARMGLYGAGQPARDAQQVRQFLASRATVGFLDSPWSPIFLLIIFLMHWLLGVVALTGLIVLLLLARLNERLSSGGVGGAQKGAGEAMSLLDDALANAPAVDAMGMREPLSARWRRRRLDSDATFTDATDRIGAVTAAAKSFRMLLQSAMLGAGAFLAVRNEVTPGVMIAASIIVGRALAPIEMITGQWRSVTLALNAYRRLRTFLSAQPASRQAVSLPKPSGALDVEALVVQPGPDAPPILKGISFSLSPGEMLGVIGPSAAGKSTLARAIVGASRRLRGAVRLDGVELEHWKPEDLGRFIGYLPQEFDLFEGSVAENISRFHENGTDEDMVRAAMAAGVHKMVSGLGEGYASQVGPRGRRLSVGQRQRIALARALYGEPMLVVLDEPDSNLDSEGDAALAMALKQLKARGATTIIIAHRPSATAFVDKLLVLDNGVVRAFGPRDEVLRGLEQRRVIPITAPTRTAGMDNG
ncbi:MAG: type I secretion system permease/ATPase [Alphaproteobacteria bacterium]|nr:type I secretion system permease/ATPase [Alphaproteobacteria bacterium]